MGADRRSMRAVAISACMAIACLVPAPVAAQAAAPGSPPASPYAGQLAKAVYQSADVAQALDALAGLAPADAKPLLAAASGRARQPIDVPAAPGGAPGTDGQAKRRALASAMVAVVPGPEARAESVAAAQALLTPSRVEDAQGIGIALGLADAAEGYLKAHRDSALTPYLYGYLMVQYRLAFERQAAAKALDGQKASARKYRAFLLRARASADPLVQALVADIDAPLHLERPTAEHPRDFDPDACCRNR